MWRVADAHDICGAREATRDVKRFWDELTGGCTLELIRPHVELGLDHSTMGLGVWSASEDPAVFAPVHQRSDCH